MAYTTEQFLNIIKPYVIADAKRANILASVTAAQAIIESANGNSALSRSPNNNLFGIKGAYNGQSVYFNTQEWNGSAYYTVKAAFRKYPSWKESIQDHNDFLLKNSRYKNLIGDKNYMSVCQKLQIDGYATSPTYANTLINTIQKYGLNSWDDETGGGTYVPDAVKDVSYGAVVTASVLNVRTGAGQNFKQCVVNGHVFQLPYGIVIAIEKESNGFGKLAGYNGWVSLMYLKKG